MVEVVNLLIILTDINHLFFNYLLSLIDKAKPTKRHYSIIPLLGELGLVCLTVLSY